MPHYCIVASIAHVRSFADLFIAQPEVLTEVLKIHAALEQRLGPILLTEHGRVPLCNEEESGSHEAHCYHAHGLCFPTHVNIEAAAASFYADSRSFNSMNAALRYAADEENYLLISAHRNSFAIFSKPLNAPRQLARALVANSLNVPHLTDWRSAPQTAEAQQNASKLRAVLASELP